MRLKLEMKLENSCLPKDNHSSIMSFLKKALSECNNGREFEKFYKNTNIKNFTFTLGLGKCKYEKAKIILENNKFYIILSITNKGMDKFIIYNALLNQKNRKFKLPQENSMTLVNIIQLKSEEIISSKVIFKTSTGSGLCVRKHDRSNKDKYFVFNDDGFEEQLKEVLKLQGINAGFSESICSNIKFIPINCRKVVSIHYGRYIDVTVGSFQLEGDSRLLQHFYESGLGSRSSMGYGMIDILEQEGGI